MKHTVKELLEIGMIELPDKEVLLMFKNKNDVFHVHQCSKIGADFKQLIKLFLPVGKMRTISDTRCGKSGRYTETMDVKRLPMFFDCSSVLFSAFSDSLLLR